MCIRDRIRVEILGGIFISLYKRKEIISDVAIVDTIIGRDWAPVCKTVERLSPKPSRTTAYCKIFFEVKLIPGARADLSLINIVIIIPKAMANTGPPIIEPATGIYLAIKSASTAMARHKTKPFQLEVIKVLIFLLIKTSLH